MYIWKWEWWEYTGQFGDGQQEVLLIGKMTEERGVCGPRQFDPLPIERGVEYHGSPGWGVVLLRVHHVCPECSPPRGLRVNTKTPEDVHGAQLGPHPGLCLTVHVDPRKHDVKCVQTVGHPGLEDDRCELVRIGGVGHQRPTPEIRLAVNEG